MRRIIKAMLAEGDSEVEFKDGVLRPCMPLPVSWHGLCQYIHGWFVLINKLFASANSHLVRNPGGCGLVTVMAIATAQRQ